MALKLQVTLDGQNVDVDVKESDLVRLEDHDRQFARDLALAKQNGDSIITPKRVYLLAWIALSRMRRRGLVDLDIPADPDDFIDIVDAVTAEEDGEPAGKPSGQGASTGE